MAHLSEVFADDWQFTTGEALRGDKWFPILGPQGGEFGQELKPGRMKVLIVCAGSSSVH